MKTPVKRKIAQLAALAACNMGISLALKTGLTVPFMYCHGCPLAAFACPIGAIQNFLGMRKVPFLVLGILALAFLFLGRATCGWLCPFGALQDLLASLTVKRTGRRPLRHQGPGWTRYLKFLILGATLATSYALAGPTFCWFCPIGALFAGIPYAIMYSAYGLGLAFYVHMAILALVLLAALKVPRFWCRYLCPLGAISGLFNKVSVATAQLDLPKCVECHMCLAECPMGLSSLDQIGSSVECILCGRCSEACPVGAVKLVLSTGG